MVQIVTEYVDRFISSALVLVFTSCMISDTKAYVGGGYLRGTV